MRYAIVDAASGEVATYASNEQAYTGKELCALLAECGYGEVLPFADRSRGRNTKGLVCVGGS
jgi:hypothetical protein